VTGSPPSAGDFTCPSGQRLVLASVTYTNISLTDDTTPLTASIPGSVSRTFFAI
jgi:hypothetical protein